MSIDDFVSTPEMKGLPYKTPYSDTIKGSMPLSVALSSFCKLIIAPDSVFIYLADSLGIPVIGLYSPFSSALRTPKLNVFTIDVPGPCYNCCIHSPMPCPNSTDTWSCCLKAILPMYVLKASEQILKGEI
jgi:ADP-heptose:LPS heptosyltransferase